ncbi:restriction endonuclease subunit S [Heyndrickxia coagulans]|uniref:restriction endonuclease subunit S n=1 Tax=Heyndrickxia coagulans TaxID=1398 RepID=UPI002E1F8F24|nr:restriction endonuclease subunit S [Heyndrickxia coagulans]MED4934733.1 restriction endonuclease subunit S [Heyndrickxia coagulans]
MEQTKLVPKRRFKEFQNAHAWEQRKLGEIAGQTYGGGTPRTSVKEYWDGSIPWIQSSDLTEGKVSGVIPNKSITEEGLKNSATKLVPRNSIAIITRVGVGKLAFMPFQYTTSQDFLSLSNLKTNPWFTAYASYKKLQSVLNSVQGTSIKGITKEELLSKSIFIPCNKEQAKIGEFFKQLDNLITLHQRKLEKTKALKSAYLSEMFPAEGERVPKRRFAGFTQPWEQRKLGEVADIIGGGTPSTSNENYWDGEIDWYSPVEIGEKIYVDSSQRKITELGLQKSSAKILPIGTVLFTSRAGIGNTAILAKEGATNQGFQSIVPHKDELDSYFIYSRSHELKHYGETNGAGSTFVEISGKQMAKMPMLIPALEEQKKIGSFFERLDHLITLQQRKLEKLQNLKKAYLNEMFV